MTTLRAIGALAILFAILSACSSLSSPPAIYQGRNAQVSGSVRPNGGNSSKWIYTAQLYGNDLQVYIQNGLTLTPFATITQNISQPAGTRATINGAWYVTNGGHSNILIYKTTNNGPVGPNGTLDDYGEIPNNVDVIPNQKLVAVSNLTTTSGGPGSVSVYLNRQTEPSRVLTYGSDQLSGEGIAIDHQGNCYWSLQDQKTGGAIVEFMGCAGTGTPIVTKIGQAGGLVFDQRDDLYYVDQQVGVYKCNFTSNCKKFATGFGQAININFDQKQKDLWVADGSGYIDAIDPKKGKIEYTLQVTGSPPTGIAAAPGG